MKTLFLDIETRPHEGYVWGTFNQNVSLNQLIEVSSLISWAASWRGSDETIFSSQHMTSRRSMMKELHLLMDEADEVCGWNSDRFDIPIINKEFLLLRMAPPSPYKKVDLMKTVKKNFRFASNKLQHVAEQLGVGSKLETGGFDLWAQCILGDDEAWEKMEEYNRQDVILLEELYDILLPWSSNLVNRSLLTQELACPNCGGKHYHERGTRTNGQGTYKRYQCKKCDTWFRSNKSVVPRGTERGVLC